MIKLNLAPLTKKKLRRLQREGLKIRAAVHKQFEPMFRITSDVLGRRLR